MAPTDAVPHIGSDRDDDDQQSDQPPLQGLFSLFISSPVAGDIAVDENPSSEQTSGRVPREVGRSPSPPGFS
jgi:hypothetical protein